jgi:hypothetical protein
MVQYFMKQDSDKKLVHKSSGGGDGVDVVHDTTLTPEEKAYRDQVIPLLLVRAYHLPNNNWYQDWVQYMTNNHPVWGIFWYHRYHPVTRTVRIFSLIGSMLFGLAITNIIYLAFVFSSTDYDTSYVEVHVPTSEGTSTGNTIVDNTVPALSVTNGNIALWTIGAFLHASYDNLIWSLAACSCCMAERGVITEKKLARYRSTGVLFVMLSVVIVTALATLAVTLRAALSSDDATEEVVDPAAVHSYGLTDDSVQLFQVDGANDFEFILAYLVELVLNYFLYYPIVGTVLFSGILTCGRYGVFGGRPYELKEAAELELEDDHPKEANGDLEQPQQPVMMTSKKAHSKQ